MADDNLFQKLFNKSGDELKKIEGDSPLLAPATEAPPEMSEEDRRIMERVRQFREQEGRNPDTGKEETAMLGEEDPYDTFLNSEELDPTLRPLAPDQDANAIEEQQLAYASKQSADFIFGDNMDAIVRSIKSAGGPENEPGDNLFEGLAHTAVTIMEKQYNELKAAGEKPEPAVFLSPTGLIPIVNTALWQVAQQMQLPGSDDPNQFAAALMNTYRKVGEKVVESGDEESIAQAEQLMITMTEEGMAGGGMPQQPQAPVKRPVAAGVAEGIGSGSLLGSMG